MEREILGAAQGAFLCHCRILQNGIGLNRNFLPSDGGRGGRGVIDKCYNFFRCCGNEAQSLELAAP